MSSNKRRASDAAVGDAASLKVKSEKNEEKKKSKTTDDIGKTSVEATPKKIKKEKKTKKEKGEPKEKKAKKEKDDKKDEKKDDKKDEKKVKKVKKEKKDEKTDEKTDEKKVKKVKKEKKEKKEKDGQEDKEKKEKKEKKPKKKDDDSSIVPEVQTGDISHHLTAIASPLATKADSIKKIHKLIGMASQDKTNFIRGLKHVAKQLRKGTKGLCILAGNVSPVDVISHFPSFCQEKEVPYIFLRTKEEIGSAAGVKRSITVALISDSLTNKEAKELMAAIIKDRSKAVPMKNDALKMEF